ncbi:MAG: aldo/keto reductase [Paracholeplasma sp.]|jgi:diketogulonate reductase-like aldo/keto reductase|uniref:Aldo/keto reductase family protein n=1 Tax=Acholeplasma brassicae TaxID=61635 RepID=U4KRL9_9MOLU|nr:MULTISPECIES: aldo/keto reductase [Paracholeplasma]MDY3195614.1 aldo/keto reductase [Paracholeplasma sp.]CCV65858.1 Aldo/keto reductase family protein [Paracholeplasma brassicae]
MLTKTLANGVKMPMLGLGTFLVGEGPEAYDTVLQALKDGYRHIDTAQMYFNEESVGRAIKDSGIPREEIFVTTKLNARKLGYQEAIDELNVSLKKLGLDYVDLYIIHWPSPSFELNQATWKGMEVCYQNKKARAIGVSNFKIHHLDSILKTAKIYPMVNQVEMHPGLNQTSLQKYMAKYDIQMISYGPFMKGEVFNPDGPYFEGLKQVADKHHITVAQAVIAWGLARGVFMIPKSVTPKRIIENLHAQDVELTKEDVEAINLLNRGRRVYTDPDNNSFVKQA